MKRILLYIFLFVSIISNAQADTAHHKIDVTAPYIHKGILAGVGTVGVGEMPVHNIANVYVTGNLEYYAEQQVSIRGDGYFFVNSLTPGSILRQNSSIYIGPYYHFLVYGAVGHSLDPVIGFQPGMAYARTTDTARGKADPGAVSPLLSVIAGFNFYGDKWFHIQLNLRYTVGQESTDQSQYNLNELSFNFGLGFNIDMISKKNHYVLSHRPDYM